MMFKVYGCKFIKALVPSGVSAIFIPSFQYIFVLFVLDNSILASEFAWPSFFFISNLDKFWLTFDSSFHCTFIHVREENSLFSELQGLQLRNFGGLKQLCLYVCSQKRRPCTFGQSLFDQFSNKAEQKKSETDQKFPETRQFFFGRPKKMRKRPDNWSTKRLTKTTWTGLWSREVSTKKWARLSDS